MQTYQLDTGPSARTATGVSAAKHSDAPNADLWGAEGGLVWVLDGASQPPGSACCAFGAPEYVAAVDRSLRHWQGRWDGGDASLHTLLAYAVAAATGHHRQHHPTGWTPPGPSATVALAQFDGWACQWAILGDAGLVFGNPPALHTDARLELVAVEERAAWEADHTDLSAWRAMYEAEQSVRNQMDGYWVLADDIAAPAWAVTGRVTVPGRVILTTDGIHRHIGTGRLWPAPAALYSAAEVHSPAELLDQARRHEAEQGLRTDDATIVVVDCAR